MTWNLPSSVGKMFPGTHEGWKGAQPTPHQIPAVPPKANSASPCCVPGTETIDATFSVGPATDDTHVTDDLCTNDMALRVTIDAWNTGSYSFAFLFGRSDLSGNEYGYGIANEAGSGFTTVTIGLYLGSIIATGAALVAELTGQAPPVHGDIYELSVVGSTVLGKKNGVTILTATDTAVVYGSFGGVEIQNRITLAPFEAESFC